MSTEQEIQKLQEQLGNPQLSYTEIEKIRVKLAQLQSSSQ
jgi:hypothetical protein